MAGGRLQTDPLFLGLARPTMIAGVSFMYFVLNSMITMLCFINTKSFAAFLLGIVIHLFGYILCMKEPRAVEMWMLFMRTAFQSWNKVYHGNTNSYDVF